jgi:hypothetical protein
VNLHRVFWFFVGILIGLVFVDTADAHSKHPAPNWHRWIDVAACETGGGRIADIDWEYSGPGYYDGALQFDPGTWRTVQRGRRLQYRYAYEAPPWVQILRADQWRRRIGGNPAISAGWPHCGNEY